ncbi:hypothetical protein QBC42DRAFT_250297 [Cladorrhinum samala]|uniref:Uncharacterized protein n=1 Tax=Cladorrhinum samala TaxID=585594 RepID=A0AAV9HUN4_9PEZI|nr:hypothetical protein QBC42DRAFT_250297 [Cladorrhinum samala]
MEPRSVVQIYSSTSKYHQLQYPLLQIQVNANYSHYPPNITQSTVGSDSFTLYDTINKDSPKSQDFDERDTKCPRGYYAYCCDKLDYSGMQVKCVGVGAVSRLEDCLLFEPMPMCCCGHPAIPRLGLPTVKRIVPKVLRILQSGKPIAVIPNGVINLPATGTDCKIRRWFLVRVGFVFQNFISSLIARLRQRYEAAPER